MIALAIICSVGVILHIGQLIMKNNKTSDLVSFGNYLLSEERMGKVSDEMKDCVTHADLENWKETKKNER